MILFFAFASCEKFPKENDLIGKWILLEQPDPYQTTLEFSDKYLISSGVYYTFPDRDTVFYRNTYLYSLKRGNMYLFSEKNSEATSSLEISLNKKKDELTILGWTPYIPEQGASKTVFKKE